MKPSGEFDAGKTVSLRQSYFRHSALRIDSFVLVFIRHISFHEIFFVFFLWRSSLDGHNHFMLM